MMAVTIFLNFYCEAPMLPHQGGPTGHCYWGLQCGWLVLPDLFGRWKLRETPWRPGRSCSWPFI